MVPRLRLVTPVLLVLAVGSAALLDAQDLEDALERRLRGSWGVALADLYSGCGGFYTNNHASVGGVASKGDIRFAPGELVKIDKINLKRGRLDLFLTLAEPLLTSYTDGPFELFAETECQVQLMIDLPRPLVRSGSLEAVLEMVTTLVEIHPRLDGARSSPSWNGRVRDPYPEDYEVTLARHAVWRAEQINAAVAARSDEALEDALRVLAAVDADPAYLDGFAAGVEEIKSWYERDCEDLVDLAFVAVEESPPSARRDDDDWCDGFRDGQLLALSLHLADRLRDCFVPLPPPLVPEP